MQNDWTSLLYFKTSTLKLTLKTTFKWILGKQGWRVFGFIWLRMSQTFVNMIMDIQVP
jgi:hypothetical protein